ncbi:Multiple C2 and transmembrane domain-containing protein 1 [Portunus trituberculatus]|uniref:Multiple C2 and transmembrane domain-containing protein 1 n=1 Tax=Portunus trituberculatus TaxID=210409 RepID=A0A5B7DJX3_PORTR|nr:Multiple C2 and transmembrane domain-containing protein 1 [Portunus trituberculatus]
MVTPTFPGCEEPPNATSLQVFDYDWGLQDDFMGLATIDLTTLDLDKCTDVELPLSEPRKASPPYMGKLYMSLTLQPKTQEEKEQVGAASLSPSCVGKNSSRGVYCPTYMEKNKTSKMGKVYPETIFHINAVAGRGGMPLGSAWCGWEWVGR